MSTDKVARFTYKYKIKIENVISYENKTIKPMLKLVVFFVSLSNHATRAFINKREQIGLYTSVFEEMTS